jgi:hypothetical protein
MKKHALCAFQLMMMLMLSACGEKPVPQDKTATATPVAPGSAALSKPAVFAPSPPMGPGSKIDSRAKTREELVERRRAAIQREQEALHQMKPKGPCVYKSVMSDEDIANCR